MSDRRDAGARPPIAPDPEAHPAERFGFYMEAVGLALLMAAALIAMAWPAVRWILG